MKKYNIVNNALGWLCFLIAAVTYLLTIEPTASFWDCPEFISQGAKLEVGHPPGNPIFMLAARFFVTLFGNNIGNAAVAVNSMSALLSAATILLLFWTITHLVRKIMVGDDEQEISWTRMAVIMGAGLCGALAYTWSDTFWFSAVEGEVYAFSSFCTALVFWLILKWENRADEPHSDRYLVLIAYVIGVSIAVHLLNLLCIPAIVLVFYYRKWRQASAKGSLIALGVSVVLVAAILYGLVPGYIKVAQGFELLFVNSFGMGFNSGVLAYAIVLVAVFVLAIWAINKGRSSALIRTMVFLAVLLSGLTFATDSKVVWALLTLALAAYVFVICKRLPLRVLNVAILSIFFIFVGYSSYALLLIRASANTPMNQNAPDNVFTLASYLNREQYGQRPLFYGPVWGEAPALLDTEQGVYMYLQDGKLATTPITNSDILYFDSEGYPMRKETMTHRKVVKTSPSDPDRYEPTTGSVDYKYSPQMCVPFTRIYNLDRKSVEGYKSWGLHDDIDTAALRKKMPPYLYQQLVQNECLPAYAMIPYVPGLKKVSRVKGDPNYDTYLIKASFADNLRYFFNYQLNHMYWRYFMWNFAGRQNDIQGNGEPNLGNWISGIPFIDNARLGDQSLLPDYYGKGNKGHNVFYMLPLLMGIIGLAWQSMCRHRRNPDRGIEQFWVVFFLFFMTGVAIVLYLNQTPGQPRERDYAFAGSFYAFAIWLGMGVPAIYRLITWAASPKGGGDDDSDDAKPAVAAAAAAVACAIGLAVPLQMVSQTWDDHDRSHRYTTRDFGANYLYSLDDKAVIFTNGDNDTFPLWYAQEVEGIRADVRVVNLSYLSTDWYANQLKHPYYDAPAVPMLAEPLQYSSDNYQYGQVVDRNTQPVPAIETLREFYADGLGELTKPLMYAPVDSVAAAAKFGIKPERFDSTYWSSTLGDIEMPALANSGKGFYLNKLLSFDIVANSVDGNFERPVYFATTVPGEYYLDLQPYLYSTGVALQVAPFKNAKVSPLADKGYENIMSRFRWGGLDDPKHNKGLYLDETVRRMVSTMRASITDIATQLIRMGDRPATTWAVQWAKDHGQPVPANHYDMARNLLRLSEEKLPYEAMEYENMSDVTLALLYFNLYEATGNRDDEKRAGALLDIAIERYAKLAKYVASLPESRRVALNVQDLFALQQLPQLVAIKNYRDIRAQALAKGDDDLTRRTEEFINQTLLSSDATPYYYLYVKRPDRRAGMRTFTEPEELEMYASFSDVDSVQAKNLLGIAKTLRLYKEIGIDRKKDVEKVIKRYGLSYDEFNDAVE